MLLQMRGIACCQHAMLLRLPNRAPQCPPSPMTILFHAQRVSHKVGAGAFHASPVHDSTHRYEYESSEVKTGSMRSGKGSCAHLCRRLFVGEGGGDDFERASSPADHVSAPGIKSE